MQTVLGVKGDQEKVILGHKEGWNMYKRISVVKEDIQLIVCMLLTLS